MCSPLRCKLIQQALLNISILSAVFLTSVVVKAGGRLVHVD